jgi:regulator of cell morphogenesis and NO signaling
MIDDFDRSLSDIVKQDYRTADVFKKYQLSFCCGGVISLKSACETQGIDYDLILNDLRESTQIIILPNNLRFDEWGIDFLIDFIIHIYHTYIYQEIQSLSRSMESFTLSHQAKYPELISVTEIFTKLTGILLIHIKHEEDIIFPYMKQIDSAHRRKEPYGNLFVRTLRKPLHIVEKENMLIQELLNELKVATKQFTASDKVCLNYKVHFKKLEAAFNILIQHQYLENHLLFPKAITIEQNLLQL